MNREIIVDACFAVLTIRAARDNITLLKDCGDKATYNNNFSFLLFLRIISTTRVKRPTVMHEQVIGPRPSVAVG